MSVDRAGNNLNEARKFDINSNLQSFTDRIDNLDSNNFYSFSLNHRSSFYLDLDGLSASDDVDLIEDTNSNSQIDSGEVLATSTTSANTGKSINTVLGTGSYYIRVYPQEDAKTNYQLSVSATPFEDAINQIISSTSNIFSEDDNTIISPSSNIFSEDDFSLISPSSTPFNSTLNTPKTDRKSATVETSGTNNITSQSPSGSTNIIAGTLRADTFNYQSGFLRTIYFGNGNVDYGTGARDVLNLANISSATVTGNFADSLNGGVVYNAGNGNRLYDALTLSDGSEILFMGIETLKLADKTFELSVRPNDPLFDQQWNLHITGVQDAWRISTGSNKVLIGIADTGLGTDSSGNIHPDLRGTTFVGNNYLDESATYSHGTRVEGAIAAATNNGVGIAGINWQSEVQMIDVIGDNPGDYNLVQTTQTLIDRANSQGQRVVINLSLSGGSSPQFEQLIANNQDKALFVIATGNGDTNSIASPASLAQTYNNVIAVGSSWGTKDWDGNAKTPGERITNPGWWGSQYGAGITLMAPSEFVATSATRTDASVPYQFGYYDRFNGTSASVANVTGIASLVWSVNPNLSAIQIRAILSETAYDLGTPGYDTVYGYGLVNADAAVRRAEAIRRGSA